MVAITVSREFGSGGTRIARDVADRLSARLLDREIIEMGFQLAGIPVTESPQAPSQKPMLQEKEVPGLAQRIVDAITGPIAAGLQPWPRYSVPEPEAVGEEDSLLRGLLPSDEAYVSLLRVVFDETLKEQGSVVITGRGGQCILSDHTDAFHVHVTATLPDRIRSVAELRDIDELQAADLVHRYDEERARYIRRYFSADWLNPSLYHMTLNTSRLTHDQAVQLVLQGVTFTSQE